MNKLEGELQASLLLEAPHHLQNLRLFRRNIATIRIERRVMKFGVAGQCDLYGILRGGRHIEVELKAASGSLSSEQRQWRDFCAAWEIPWITLKARPLETVEQTVSRWVTELAAIA